MSGAEKKENISIVGAKTNNLKNITVQIPLDSFSCVIGPSGCGKSSLVYDTIYAESQRNFLEGISGNLSGQKIMDKPAVDCISNLRPTINLAQNYYNVNPRSTVGTISEVSYYLRAFFALIADELYSVSMSPGMFSPNTVSGCCNKCNGLGTEFFLDSDKIITDSKKSLREGAISFFKGTASSFESKLLEEFCNENNIDIDSAFNKLSPEQQRMLFYGTEKQEYNIRFKNSKGKYRSQKILFRGVYNELTDKLQEIEKPSNYTEISSFISTGPCSRCKGKRYSQNTLSIRFLNNDIDDIESTSLSTLLETICLWKTEFNKYKYKVQYDQLWDAIEIRIRSMIDLNLGHLSLNRIIPSLSGGEIQRIRIATQMNCSLAGLIYILDEPCRGLHFRNVEQIIKASKTLVRKGNTVVAIEHNPMYISSADNVIEMGPEGGKKGGYIIETNKIIPQYDFKCQFHKTRGFLNYLRVSNVSLHNIHNQSFLIPENCLTCVTGVSGSGKSTLAQVLIDSFQEKKPIHCSALASTCKALVHVNQQPIGKNSRSTVVSYLEIYEDIRKLFSETNKAKELGLTPSSFSFNVEGERCECCQGTGFQKIEMNYLPDSYILCPECNGNRFSDKVLQVTYKGLTITDVLNQPVEEIASFFDNSSLIRSKINCLLEIGLGYLSLGQLTAKLSGGESQRIKLAKALGMSNMSKRLFLLDEPTSGLNQTDIDKFKAIINRLTDNGNTLLIIEHNLDFISSMADAVLDFGLVPGENGGKAILYKCSKDAFTDPNSSLFGLIKD